jgi:hypothetical protein
MRKRPQLIRKMSLLVFALASLVVLGLPSGQAGVLVQATNDRCGPQAGGGLCTTTGALDVATAVGSGDEERQSFEFETANVTAGPLGIDVVGGFPKDVWFRLPGPHCPGKRLIISTRGSTHGAAFFIVTEGGGLPFFVCDSTCDSVAGNPFFDIDVVISVPGGFSNFTIPPAQAGRDFYLLVDAGNGNQTLRLAVSSGCR